MLNAVQYIFDLLQYVRSEAFPGSPYIRLHVLRPGGSGDDGADLRTAEDPGQRHRWTLLTHYRLSGGMPSLYLPVSNPWANGLKTVTPMPCLAQVGRTSDSICRSSML